MAKMNRYERGTNKKAKIRKERAKAKALGVEKSYIDETDKILEQPKDFSQATAIISYVNGWNIQVYFDGCTYNCKLSSLLSKTLTSIRGKLVVGDFVNFIPENDFSGIIYSRITRRSSLYRLRGDAERISVYKKEKHVLAANIDLAIIVASIENPRFYPGLVDRYLIICQLGKVTPVICINKCDLPHEKPAIIDWYHNYLGIQVIFTSTKTLEGVSQLRDNLRNKTGVFVGNSGVGKSTITQIFLPSKHIETREVSQKHHEGRHTTTATSLYAWDDNSFIIDTPGIRDLSFSGILREELQDFFPEISLHADSCEFSDCIHLHEENCGVKRALAAGLIPQERYRSYISLLEDLY